MTREESNSECASGAVTHPTAPPRYAHLTEGFSWGLTQTPNKSEEETNSESEIVDRGDRLGCYSVFTLFALLRLLRAGEACS